MAWKKILTNSQRGRVKATSWRKNTDNDWRTALNWTPERRRKRGRPKTTWRRTAEREKGTSWIEVLEWGTNCSGLQKLVGGIALRPYVPHNTKKIVPQWRLWMKLMPQGSINDCGKSLTKFMFVQYVGKSSSFTSKLSIDH